MNKRLLLTFSLALLVIACHNEAGRTVVETFAGNGKMELANGRRSEASFANLMGIAADKNGNLYIADSHNNVIRKIDGNGIVTILAGTGAAGCADGPANTASFFYPTGIAVDDHANVYVSDTHNNLVRKIDSRGFVTTLAGKRFNDPRPGFNDTVKFDNPAGIAVDRTGNVYVADWGNDVIRKIHVTGGVSTLSGSFGTPGCKDGFGSSASFYLPWGIALDRADNVYVSDSYNNMIRKISPAGMVSTVAGKKDKGASDGHDTSASFFHPAGIAFDRDGNLYIADMGNNKIRRLSPAGRVTTVAGTGDRGAVNGRDTKASFRKPYDVAIAGDGCVYVADYLNNLVRKINF